jgi:hypothetical protein
LDGTDYGFGAQGWRVNRYAGAGILLLLGAAALFLSHDFIGAPYLSNDSVQYLDAASHLAADDCLCTMVAHFDEQVALGHMPIPFTHFAPAYPLLIAGLMKLGFASETAGYLISALSYLVTIALFWYIGCALGAHPWALGALGLLWITNSIAILTAGFVSTEALFTAVFLGIAALMMADMKAAGTRPPILLGIGILAAALYWVRYAGLFVVPVAGLYLVWRGWRNRRTLPWVLAGVAAEGAGCLAIAVRNSRLTGSWRGGFSTGEGHSVKFILVESVKAAYHLVFGDRVVAHLNIWAIVFAGALVAALALAFTAWRSGRAKELPEDFATRLAWLAALVGIYVAGIIYAALHSIAADLARYYFPAYPLVLVVLAAVSLARKPLENAAIAALVAAILVVHSRSLLTPPTRPLAAAVQQVFQEEVEPGISVGRWLSNHVSPKDVIVATNGQAVHYILNRPVVAVINPAFTGRRTDEVGFHAVMDQFRARYLLVFPGSKVVQEQDDIPFLRSLAAGSPPGWLSLAAKARDAELYECASCVGSTPSHQNRQ